MERKEKTSWTAFEESVKNPRITDAVRMMELGKLIKDDAALYIKDLEWTDESFKIAKAILFEQYENLELKGYKLIKELESLEQPKS
jgi:hypothetical protein